jgi:hypothetical protein
MADKFDGIDIGHMQETVRSRGFEIIVERMRAIHAAKLRELRDSKLSHDDTQAIRGFLDGIDRCLAVPEQIRQEWEARKAR